MNSKRNISRKPDAKSEPQVRCIRLVMRPGLKVWTETTSGQPILCTVSKRTGSSKENGC